MRHARSLVLSGRAAPPRCTPWASCAETARASLRISSRRPIAALMTQAQKLERAWREDVEQRRK